MLLNFLDLSVLPSLNVTEIDRKSKTYPITVNHSSSDLLNRTEYFRLTSTNGLSYLKIGMTIDHIPERLKPYLPLFCQVG